ncbi:type II toxin-antitoxin system PemK/MazF family toxin [bacterium]|nr:type II toxin-antitoxin system PemK/MazF family toxin [bacterium]
MMVKQGEIYWVDLGELRGSEPGYRHPHIVVQNNLFNASRIKTVVVCTLTTNLKRAAAPGNVTLPEGEANLAKQSVVNVSQLYTVDEDDLVERIGQVSREKLKEVLLGIELLLKPRDLM